MVLLLRLVSRSDGSHAVVACVVRDLGQSEGLQQGWEVHAESAPIALALAVTAPDRGVRRTPERLDSALGGFLLLVGRPERHPVTLLGQPTLQVLDRPQV